jgi:hypothetical protein
VVGLASLSPDQVRVIGEQCRSENKNVRQKKHRMPMDKRGWEIIYIRATDRRYEPRASYFCCSHLTTSTWTAPPFSSVSDDIDLWWPSGANSISVNLGLVVLRACLDLRSTFVVLNFLAKMRLSKRRSISPKLRSLVSG